MKKFFQEYHQSVKHQARHFIRPDLGPNCKVYQQTTLAGTVDILVLAANGRAKEKYKINELYDN